MVKLKKRASGLLLHITSLPSGYGIGDLGHQAYDFIDFLKKSGQSYWQILPLNPTSRKKKYSPYASFSAFGANTLLISPSRLYEDGFLNKKDFEDCRFMEMSEGLYPVKNTLIKKLQVPKSNGMQKGSRTGYHYLFVDYKKAACYKKFLLDRAFENFIKHPKKILPAFNAFIQENDNTWLDRHACFYVFNDYFTQKNCAANWRKWPAPIRNRNEYETGHLSASLCDEIKKEKFFQFLFYRQWYDLKKYANERAVKIIGDLPIYVDYNSSDVWSYPEIFKLDRSGKPSFLAGVPPDYFSRTGQLWKNPVYDWDKLKSMDFSWWIKRIEHNFRLFDLVRIDHFRGFIAYWEVPSGSKTAENGWWTDAYPYEFFRTLKYRFGSLPVIAENLGFITEDVEEVMKEFDFPGTKVLQFAFGKEYPYERNLPDHYTENTVVYTGTHDNNTVRGWLEREASPHEKLNLENYVSKKINPSNISEVFVKLAMSSRANLSIIPIQDILGLGNRARMNHPSTTSGNWQWQACTEMFSDENAERLLKFTSEYGRG